MSYIVFENVDKHFGAEHVLKNINMSIEKGQFITLLGPSGCGKSTLLRCLAGLEKTTNGKIFLDGEDITFKNAKYRNVGMIFQQYSLFPTMNVFNNVAFGLKMKRIHKEDIEKSVLEALRMVDLSASKAKYPSQLSGGEQQRVALARCIVTKPKVLLLDEPFSAIDAKLRKSLQARIKEIHKELQMTSIFVTHDQDEAMRMADVIHLLNKGIIEQTGRPIDIYTNPKTSFAASFMGNYNMLSSSEFKSAIGEDTYNGRNIVIRPETIAIASQPIVAEEASYCIKGTVKGKIPQGNIVRYKIDVNDVDIKVDVLFNTTEFFEDKQTVYLNIYKDSVLHYSLDN